MSHETTGFVAHMLLDKKTTVAAQKAATAVIRPNTLIQRDLLCPNGGNGCTHKRA